MRQGRKSKWTMRAFWALAALLLVALAVPASVVADAPATEEYELDLPAADGEGEAGSDEDDEAAVAPPTSTPPTVPQTESVAPAAPESGEQGGGPADEARGEPSNGLFESPAPNRPAQNLPAADSGDGGFPALLLLLGAIAGVSAGFAVWRMRREGGSDAHGAAATDVSTGTQSP
jgi:hypothetical protein